jgi:hypothetical protein
MDIFFLKFSQKKAKLHFFKFLNPSKNLKSSYQCFLFINVLLFLLINTAAAAAPSNISAKQATIVISTDNAEEVYFNGKRLGSSREWKQARTYKVALQQGKNVLAVKAMDKNGIAGLISQITVGNQVIVSDKTWKISKSNHSGWQKTSFNDSKWGAAKSYGKYGTSPWKKNVKGFPKNSSAQWIWSNNRSSDNTAYFRYTLNVDNTGGDKNQSPIEVSTKSNSSVEISFSDYAVKPKTVFVTGKPSHGAVSITGNKVKYTPKPGYKGQDTFLVKITNRDGSTIIRSITVSVGDTETSKTNKLTLTWNPSSGEVLGYTVYVGPTSGTVTKQLSDLHISSKEVNQKTPSVTYDVKQDLGMTSGDFVCFRVKAYNTKGESEFSKSACTTI